MFLAKAPVGAAGLLDNKAVDKRRLPPCRVVLVEILFFMFCFLPFIRRGRW
jgi:hypothetical protein